MAATDAKIEERSKPGAAPEQPKVHKAREMWSLLALPGLALLVAFFGVALVLIVHRSLTDPSPGNYDLVTTRVYLETVGNTFRAAAIVTVATLVLGYAYAYAMHTGSRLLRTVFILILVAEFATSWLARVYSWYMLLLPNGVINRALEKLHLIKQPLHLLHNDFGMVVGTTHVLLPYMILVLYANMRQVDMATVVAAQSLGARRYQAFWHVFVPATRPGIVAGAGLIFVLTLGFYITPALLGDPTRTMISALIVTQTEQLGNFGTAATMSVTLLVLTLLTMLVAVGVARRVGARSQGGRP